MNLTILVLSLVSFAWTIGALPHQKLPENPSDSFATTLIESESIKDKNDSVNMGINYFAKEDDVSTTTTSNQELSLDNADQSIVGETTTRLSEALLAGYAESTSNIVLSPLGYSTLLALVAEGAKDETRQQILSALGIQDFNMEQTRQAFRSVLTSLKGQHSPYVNPEFKNWFYISHKYPVNEDYNQLLREYYLTEVKIIKNWLSGEDESRNQSLNTMMNKKNNPTNDESIKENDLAKTALNQIILEEYSNQINQVNDNRKNNLKEKTFEETKYSSEKIIEKKDEDDKKIPNLSDIKNDSEKNPLLDLMLHHSLKEKNNRDFKALSDQNKDSGTDIFMNKFSSKDSLDSVMLAFNGLYFKGGWPTKSITVLQQTFPFKAGLNGSKLVDARMLKFSPDIDNYVRCSYIDELQSKAYEIPFKDGRYVLLLVVPDREDGLPTLIRGLEKGGLLKAKSSLKPSQKIIIFPRFEIETTTQPRNSFNSMGLSHLFNQEKADLSGISPEQGLYVHDLAQFVAVKVEGKISSVNLITAEGFAAGRAEGFREQEKEVIDRPFAFYILDRNNGVIIVAGRIIDPTEVPPLFNISQANSFN